MQCFILGGSVTSLQKLLVPSKIYILEYLEEACKFFSRFSFILCSKICKKEILYFEFQISWLLGHRRHFQPTKCLGVLTFLPCNIDPTPQLLSDPLFKYVLVDRLEIWTEIVREVGAYYNCSSTVTSWEKTLVQKNFSH